MESWAWIVIGITVAVLGFFIWRSRRRDLSKFTGRLPEDYRATSPKGVSVASARRITPAHLAAIDAGLDLAFQIAGSVERYSGFSGHNGYKVWLFPRSPKCTDAGIYQDVSGTGGWDQTEFDKNPEVGKIGICFAGKMIRHGLRPGANSTVGLPGMVVVDDLGLLETAVYNEAEHNILIECDGPRFERTSGVHSHPIFGSAQTLRASSFFKCGRPETI